MKKFFIIFLLIVSTHLNAVKKLDLSNQGIRDIGEALRGRDDLHEIEELDLSDNEIEDLGDALKKCSHLKKLNLSYNKIHDLGDSLRWLSELEVLDLHSNEVKSLGGSLEGLVNLRYLDMRYNCLLDPVLPHLEHLHNLETFHAGDQYYPECWTFIDNPLTDKCPDPWLDAQLEDIFRATWTVIADLPQLPCNKCLGLDWTLNTLEDS